MINEKKFTGNDPFFLQWHITNKCLLSCKHCYIDDNKKNDLSLKNLKIILKKYHDFLVAINKKGRIQFSGGEPFLSDNLFILLDEAKKLKIPCRILSSGVGITEEKIEMLKKTHCRTVQISIEGLKDINDEIRGINNFDKALRSMRFLKKNGFNVTISMTISKYNYKDVKKVVKLTQNEADRFHFSRLVPIGQSSDSIHLMLKKNTVKSVFKKVFNLKKRINKIDIPLRDPLWNMVKMKNKKFCQNIVSGCSAGFNGLTIDNDGVIYPCRRLPVSLGNILDVDFFKIWNESEILKKLRNRDLLNGKCGKCKYRWICGGCRAIAYAVTGDYLDEDNQCFLN